MEPDAAFYQRAMRRVHRFMAVVACAGTAAGAWFEGGRWALSFLLGAVGSYLNFSWLESAVQALGPEARTTRKRVLVLVALRYAILGGSGYVIVRFFEMNAIALVIGLFVAIAAIILEGLYELVHAGT